MAGGVWGYHCGQGSVFGVGMVVGHWCSQRWWVELVIVGVVRSGVYAMLPGCGRGAV